MSSKVSGAQEAVSNTVSSAKDTVATRVTEAVDMTRGAMQSGVDMTKSMVTSGVHSVMGSRVGQMVLSGVDTVLGKSEAWVDNHLPMTDSELGECGLRAWDPSPDLPTWGLLLHPEYARLNEHLNEQINAWRMRGTTEESLSDFTEGFEHLLSTRP